MMEQLEFFQIPNPCVRVCEANNRGYCKGCFRSRDERLYWLKLTDAQKKDVLRLCQQRKRKENWAKLQVAQAESEKKAEAVRKVWELDFWEHHNRE